MPAGELRTPKNSSNSNLDALWAYVGACTARGAASERTKAAYGAAINLYLEWCRGAGIEPVNARERDIEDWRASLVAAGASAGTVMLRLSAVRTLYKALCRAGRVEKNPAEHVKAPKPDELPVDAVMRKIVFPDQMVVVLGKLGDDYRGRRDRAILLTLYLLGLRVSELAGMDWEAVDGETVAFTAKGGLARKLGLPEALKAAFASLQAAGAAVGPMFIGEGGRMTVRGIQKMVVARLQAAGLGQRSPHALRHSCATVAAIGGSSPFAIQDQLGHASQRTTAIYTRVAGRFLEAPSLVVAKAMGI